MLRRFGRLLGLRGPDLGRVNKCKQETLPLADNVRIPNPLMDPAGTETSLKAGAEVGGHFLGPISPALFLDVFLTEGADHDAAVETIKQRILAAKEGEEREVGRTKKREGVPDEDRKPKRPRIEVSSESTPPLAEKGMFSEPVGDPQFYSRLSVAHSPDHKARASAIQLWDPRVCEHRRK